MSTNINSTASEIDTQEGAETPLITEKTYTQADMDAYKLIVDKERAIARQAKAGRSTDIEELTLLRSDKEARELKEAEKRGDYEKSLAIQIDRASKAEAKAAAAIAKANRAMMATEMDRQFSIAKGLPQQVENFTTLAAMGLSITDDGQINYPPEALNSEGTPVDSMATYVAYLRDSGKLSFAFEAPAKAAGTNAVGVKAPPSPSSGTQTVPLAEAYKYTAEIKAGIIKVV